VLRIKGQEAQALRLCQEAAQSLEARGIESRSLTELHTTLAEAAEATGNHDVARSAVERALSLLSSRVQGIQEPALRDTYLREVPANVRLLKLATQGNFDIAALTLL
jgi:hypothetical protein